LKVRGVLTSHWYFMTIRFDQRCSLSIVISLYQRDFWFGLLEISSSRSSESGRT
jgi:hypothetical protein